MKVGCTAIVNAPTKRSFERRELASCLFRKTDQQTQTWNPGGMMAWGIDRYVVAFGLQRRNMCFGRRPVFEGRPRWDSVI